MNIHNLLLNWLTSFVIFETLFNTFAWNQLNVKKPTFETLKIYYHEMPTPIVVFGDFFYSTMIFINAYMLLSHVLDKNDFSLSSKNLINFISLIIVIQIIYDILYYLLVTYSGLHQHNDYVQFFKMYSEEYSWRAIISDSIYLLLWFLIFCILLRLDISDSVRYYILSFGGFLLVFFSYEDL